MDRSAGPEATRNRLPAVLAADALWDGLLGIVFCLVPWPAVAHGLGLPPATPWPVFLVVGAGCLVFAAVLARGRNSMAVLQVAAIGNTAAVLLAIVGVVFLRTPLRPGGAVAVAVAGAGCAMFAVLEWWAGGVQQSRRAGSRGLRPGGSAQLHAPRAGGSAT